MKHFKLLKRTTSILVCIAVMLACVTVSGFTAFAEGENEYNTESAWEMQVPQVFVYTANGNGTTLQKEDGYQQAQIFIKDTDGSMLSDACSIKVRGNTTALSWVTKKSFTFKFEKKKEVLGMGKGKKWALVANVFDPTLLRNMTVFTLAKELGLDYTSNFKAVEVWLDGSFRGCYVLFEPVQEGKERVDIDIESNDGKKDFLIEYEASRDEEGNTYFTTHDLRFLVSEPEEPDDEQLAYITNTMDDIITTIRSLDREAIAEKIDIGSFAKFYLLNEYAKTFDFTVSSVFFYYKDGKLYAGPPWDYDLSLGNTYPPYGTRATLGSQTYGWFCNRGYIYHNNLYRYICQNDWFLGEVKKVYSQHYRAFENISANGGLLDTMRDAYSDVFDRNYSTAGWRVSRFWINIMRQPDATYAGNYSYLKNWCEQRNAWIANEFDVAFLRGDTDANMDVSVDDVTESQRCLAEFSDVDPERVFLRGDVDGDGKLTIMDVTAVQRFLADAGNVYGIGEKVVAAAES